LALLKGEQGAQVDGFPAASLAPAFGIEKELYSDAGLKWNEDPKEEPRMDIGGLLSSPIVIAIAVIAGLVLLFAAWKINKLAIKLLFILMLAAIAVAVLFFRKGGF
jgi:hypothetical protein